MIPPITWFLVAILLILQISSYFSDKLLGIVRDIVLHMKEIRSENDPRVSSSNSQLAGDVHKGDAALEFIKHVCAVLALDQSVQDDVLVKYFLSQIVRVCIEINRGRKC